MEKKCDPLCDETRNRHLEEMYRCKMAIDTAKRHKSFKCVRDLRKHLVQLQTQLAIYDQMNGY
jgi:hypothetical protein